eukprot:SM007573S21904  [mRNA]  locus=s7573:3:507:- [translate_table: standard]
MAEGSAPPAAQRRYWLRYWLAAFDLPFYCFRQRRYALMLQTIATFAAFIGVTTALYQWKPVATLWVSSCTAGPKSHTSAWIADMHRKVMQMKVF